MIKLRPYQKAAVNALFDYFKEEPDSHPVIGAPTGAGKSFIIAAIIERTLRKWNNINILVISHVREIVEQDAKAIKTLTGREVGIYSAGLGFKEKKQITVAGIQSIYRKASAFAEYSFIIIDEAHTIPLEGNGMYQQLFAGIGKAKYLGLSATLFRLGGGYIYGEGRIFNGIAYDLTSRKHFIQLIKDGYLSKLKTIPTQIELDVEKNIRTQNGDFKISDMSHKFDRTPITDAAIQEIIKHGENYKKWLIFAIDIEHAEHIAETLIRNGIMSNVVHSKMEDDRDSVIRKFKGGTYRALVNVNVLTTGFDDPEIDLIALLRPTKSPVLHVQMIGRGLRIAPNKDHCLVMDFGGNTDRLGPIDNVEVKVKRKGTGGDPITKRCPKCDTIHHPAVRICEFCGYKFEFKHGLSDSSGTAVVSETAKWYTVDEVKYEISAKQNRPDVLLVMYVCSLRVFKEYINLNHSGYAKHLAQHWLKYRGGTGTTVQEAYEESASLSVPKRIYVSTAGKYPVFKDYEF